jgi:hypothetical protein
LNIWSPLYKNPINFNLAKIFIAHYFFQSKENYLRRKLNRIRDDNGNLRQPGELPFDLNIVDFNCNETENTLVRDRYSNKIHEFLNNL